MSVYISQNIRFLLSNFRLKQDEFGALFNLKKGVVSTYVSGNTKPKVDTLIEIAEHFSISIDDLLKKDLSKDGVLLEKSNKNIAPPITEQDLRIKLLEQDRDRIQEISTQLTKENGKLEAKLELISEQLHEKVEELKEVNEKLIQENKELHERMKSEAEMMTMNAGKQEAFIQELKNERIEMLSRLKKYEDISGFEANMA